MKKLLICLTVLFFGFGLTGCQAEPKYFTVQDLTITLDDSFVETSQIGVSLALVSKKYVVAITTNNQLSSYSLTSFGDLLENNFKVTLDFEDAKTAEDVDFLFATYDNTGGDSIEYSYLSAIYKNNSVFYVVDFCCEKKNNSEEVMAEFLNWAKTVVFN